MSELIGEKPLLKLARFALAAVIALNLATVSIRFLNGLPLGVDSTSHLFRVMLMSKSYQENEYVPRWNPNWYGGTPLFLLYPPLSYYLTFVVSLAGLGPILAYKLVDSTFYLLGPVGVYYLSRNIGVDKRVGILAAFLFSFSPTIVENYLFYDRFPSTVSLPLVCLFIIALCQVLADRRAWLFLIFSGVLFGTILLIHHLSALCAALLGLLLTLAKALMDRKARNLAWSASFLTIIFLIGFSLSSFWLFPFIAASNQFLSNPFYNRNVEFPFVRLSYFSINVATYAFGVAHLGLAMFALWTHSLDSGLKKQFVPITITAMLIGMALFELGEKIAMEPVRILGQGVVVFSLFGLFYVVWRKGRIASDQNLRIHFLEMSFVVLLWLSLGSFALPIVIVPPLSLLWRALDVHRFWLYLSIPMSILSAIGLKQLFVARIRFPVKKNWLLSIFLMGIVLSGGCVKILYATTLNISEFLPYPTANRDIPVGLITYFKADPTYARVLGVRCPLWIYVLPYYTNKPLIDGWYPQEKLLTRLLEINDYRILDLELAGPVEPVDSPNRTRIWRDLILNSRLLAIKWVIVGNVIEETRSGLFNGTHFELDAQFPYQEGTITVYRSSELIEMAELIPSDAGKVALSRDGPDRLTLKLDIRGSPTVVIKEAYFPTWRAVSGGALLDIGKDSDGFITMRVPSGATEIILYHKPVDFTVYYLSAATLVVLLLFVGLNLTRRKILAGRPRL